MSVQLLSWLESKGVVVLEREWSAEITPEIAREMLRRNFRNRAIRKDKVEMLRGVLERGEWEYNGDALRLSEDGRLLDGQHRLISIAESGISAEMIVVVVPDKSQTTMDQGFKRTFSDMLVMDGEQNANTVAAAVGLVWAFEQDGVPSLQNRPIGPTVQQKYDTLSRHPGVRDSVAKVRRADMISGSLASALHYLFTYANADDADAFFERLRKGEGSEGDPIFTLRERLLRERMKAGGQLHTRVRTAFVIKAFNAWRKGVQMKSLKFNPGGAKPDRFPVIEDFDRKRFNALERK